MESGGTLNAKVRPDVPTQRAFYLAYANGALWALGNGLGSTSLIIYLVRQLGATGLGISVVLAAPHIVGVLRLNASVICERVVRRKSFCVSCYAISAVLLACIAQLATPGWLASPAWTLPVIASLWCIYHLLEYLATVVLWAWLGDIAPVDIRGRFIGVRERWMLFARIAGMLLAGGFAWLWHSFTSPADAWAGYAIPACFGALMMSVAVVPLLRLSDPREPKAKLQPTLSNLFAPLADKRLRWLIAFGIWFSIANGLTQSAQFLFPIIAFAVPLVVRNIYVSGMRLGQAALAPAVGRYVDRFGNRGALIASQLIIATGPLFFLAARYVSNDPSDAFLTWRPSWYVLFGAWVAWIAYVGLNVGLPNLMLKLAGPSGKAAYVAWYFAVTGVVYGISTIAGGAVYDWLLEAKPRWSLGAIVIDHHDVLFTAGFLLRASAVLFLLPLREQANT